MRRNRLASLPAGHLVATYRIRSVLWRNGFEVIYFGNEVRTGQDVVVREYCPNDFARRKGGHVSPARPANEDNFNIGLREFFAEAEAFARQPLSAIVPTIDIFVANGTAYVVAPFAVGKRLELSLRSGPTPSTTAEIEAMFVPILDAMEAIHSAGIVHCDLCPETILFDDSGAPQLIGFSGARHQIGRASCRERV